MQRKPIGGRGVLVMAVAAIGLGVAAPVAAQWTQVHEQYYLPAAHNWVFRQNYSGADRLFNAFDYGHAILYEELYRRPNGPVERLEVKEYDFLTQRLLKRPPRVPLEEGAIEIAYVKLAPEAKNMFHWAHILHRQLYDVLADERLSLAEKDAAVAEVVAYYKSRPDVAFSSVPKSMDIMDGHYYSLAFRERYPKFNGLIWAYHWLQVGLYEPLLVERDAAARAAGVNATVGRFWQMLEDAPETMPYLMPMTAGVAPAFAERYPEASIIFDNLHMMHDVISDILASPKVPREKKREEILRAAAMFRDDTSYVIPVAEWKMMGEMMGVHNMGGLAVGFTAELPRPTVPRGMSMAGMDHSAGAEDHTQHGSAPQGQPAQDHQHGQPQGQAQGQQQRGQMHHGQAGARPMDHGAMGHGMPRDSAGGHAGMRHGAMEGMGDHMRMMHEMHVRMMADPVIRERMMADTAMHRAMMQMMQQMPAEHREEMMRMMHPEHGAHPAAPAAASPKPANPHAGHGAQPAPEPIKPAPKAAKPAPKATKPATKATKPATKATKAAPKTTRAAPKAADPHAGHRKPPASKPAPKADTTRANHGGHSGHP